MTSITVYYENPKTVDLVNTDFIKLSVPYSDRNNIHIELILNDVEMFVEYEKTHPEIDLSVWASQLSQVKKLTINSIVHSDEYHVHNIIGFENYPNLRILDISNLDRTNPPLLFHSTKSLNGIEFCEHLHTLDISNNNISDLTPISNLKLIKLRITNNPIASLTPINFTSLKHFMIDINQLELLNDDCDLSTVNKIIISNTYEEHLNHPKIIEITQKYPQFEFRWEWGLIILTIAE
jgi:hypothetical protein